MRARLTSSRFVGRVGELAELELALRDASEGTPVVVLVGGESGVGKTRLVGELERRLRKSGEPTLVLCGESVGQRDGELPYAPLLSALRPLVRGRHPALAQLTPVGRSDLATLLPALRNGPPDERREDGDPSGQVRLFEALLELLALLCESEPVALVLEDMHWADRSTRTFAAFLARSLREERVTLMLTYRTDELHRRHPLLPLLTELERQDRTRRIILSPSIARRWPRRSRTSSETRRARSWSSGCSRGGRETRSTPRSCWPPGSTAVELRPRAFAMRSCCGSSGCPRTPSGWRAWWRWADGWTIRRSPR